MIFFRKSLFPSSAAPARDVTPDRLRADIAELETELAESQRALADLEARAGAAQTRAMEAIRAGDDRTARASLLEQEWHAEKVAAVAADLKVLRAILDECYDFINKMSEDPRARGPES